MDRHYILVKCRVVEMNLWNSRETKTFFGGVRYISHHCLPLHCSFNLLDCVWNVMAHTQKTDFVFRRNGLVHLNRRRRQFIRLLAAEVCASAVVMLDTPCSEVVWRVPATHSIRQFPLHFPSCVSPCAITFQLDSTICVPFCDKLPTTG